MFSEAAPEERACLVVERKLAAGQQPNLIDLVDRALRVDIERAQRLDLVVHEIDAIRQRAAHREEVDQTAAHAVFAGRHDLRHAAVAGERELCTVAFDVESIAFLQEEGPAGEILCGSKAVESCRDGHHDDVERPLHHLVERREPVRDEILVRRDPIVGQRLPIGQLVYAQARCEPWDLLREPMGVAGTCRENHDALSGLHQLGECERIAGSGEACASQPHSRGGQ